MTSFRELYRGGAQRIRIKLEAVARSRTQLRPVRFRGGHFEDVIILLCVRWYCVIRSATGIWKR
jgi:hypothetical protein